MVNYARSGGTLLTKILNSNAEINVFSEINNIASVDANNKLATINDALISQSQKWHGFLPEGRNFIEILNSIIKINEERNVITIVRDWSFVQFEDRHFNNNSPPMSFQFLEILNQNFDVMPFAFVRDGIDVYLSRKNIDINKFEKSYTNFLEKIISAKFRVFKYEDLVSDKSKFLKEFSKFLDVKNIYDLINLSNYPSTGDSQLGIRSRGQRENSIVKLPRKLCSLSKIKEINNATLLLKWNRKLGYQLGYWNGNIQNIFLKLRDDLYKFIYKLFKYFSI